MMQINILDAKNQLSRLIKAANSGEDVVIANRGVLVARLVATGRRPDEQPAALHQPGNLIEWLATHPLPARIRRSHEEIEAGLREEREAWD